MGTNVTTIKVCDLYHRMTKWDDGYEGYQCRLCDFRHKDEGKKDNQKMLKDHFQDRHFRLLATFPADLRAHMAEKQVQDKAAGAARSKTRMESKTKKGLMNILARKNYARLYCRLLRRMALKQKLWRKQYEKIMGNSHRCKLCDRRVVIRDANEGAGTKELASHLTFHEKFLKKWVQMRYPKLWSLSGDCVKFLVQGWDTVILGIPPDRLPIIRLRKARSEQHSGEEEAAAAPRKSEKRRQKSKMNGKQAAARKDGDVHTGGARKDRQQPVVEAPPQTTESQQHDKEKRGGAKGKMARKRSVKMGSTVTQREEEGGCQEKTTEGPGEEEEEATRKSRKVVRAGKVVALPPQHCTQYNCSFCGFSVSCEEEAEFVDHCLEEHIPFPTYGCSKCPELKLSRKESLMHLKKEHKGKVKRELLELTREQKQQQLAIYQALADSGVQDYKDKAANLKAALS